jgi:hypothetical protein
MTQTETSFLLPFMTTVQGYLLMDVDMPEGQKPVIPQDLLQKARTSWKDAAKHVHISLLQSDVERVLKRMGEQPAVEYLTDDGLFSIDLAFPGNPFYSLPGNSVFQFSSEATGLLKALLARESTLSLTEGRQQALGHRESTGCWSPTRDQDLTISDSAWDGEGEEGQG